MQYFNTYIDQLRFLEACGKGDMATVKEYIDHGGNPNASTSTGTTALIYEAAHSQIEVVQYLLSIGADFTLKDQDGYNPISMARKHKNKEIVEIFQSSPYIEEKVQEEIQKTNQHQDVIESYYIGRYDFEDLILSNKNKVAQLFYQKKIGKYLHETLGLVDVLSIKQFVVKDGTILSRYEITDKTTTPLLDPILEHGKINEEDLYNIAL